MALPIKPEIPRAVLARGERPYSGEILPGEIFAWEPEMPHARELCIITKVIARTGNEPLVYTRDFPGRRQEVRNELSRFREAVVPTVFNRQSPERAV